MFWHIHLEPLDERYTIQWFRWFNAEFVKRKIDFTDIPGSMLSNETPSGQFLDWASRCHWVAEQNKAIASLFHHGQVSEGDTFYFADIWHPGLEAVAYMADLTGIDVKIYAHQHAGVFDRTDIVHPLYPWGRYQEAAWYEMCTKVFVGSEHLKRIILDGLHNNRMPYPGNIVVTGNPYDEHDVKLTARHGRFFSKGKPIVVWPHRVSDDKNPTDFFRLVNRLAPEYPDVRWIMTSGRANDEYKTNNASIEFISLTKPVYYALLESATLLVSTAYHENFGYTIREATTLGTPILCPRRACFPEMILSEGNLYNDFDELVAKTRSALGNGLSVASLKPNDALNNIFEEMNL